jgi:hypothetical protein
VRRVVAAADAAAWDTAYGREVIDEEVCPMPRTLLCSLAVSLCALAAVGIVGAGTQTPLTVTAVDSAYRMPRTTVAGGVVAIRFRNGGEELHEFAFGRIGAGHTLAEALRAAARGKEPGWLKDLGGPGPMTPGAEITVTRTLAPGTYFVFDGTPNSSGVPHWKLGMSRSFTVSGRSRAELPKADVVVTALAKRYVVPVLHGGRQTIELRNRSGAGRGFMLASLNPGKTLADVEGWTKEIESTGRLPKRPVPMTLLGAMQTIPTGTSVFVTLTLEAGRSYHLSDDESGIQADLTPR